jgi:hypothetical protein
MQQQKSAKSKFEYSSMILSAADDGSLLDSGVPATLLALLRWTRRFLCIYAGM